MNHKNSTMKSTNGFMLSWMFCKTDNKEEHYIYFRHFQKLILTTHFDVYISGRPEQTGFTSEFICLTQPRYCGRSLSNVKISQEQMEYVYKYNEFKKTVNFLYAIESLQYFKMSHLGNNEIINSI